MATFDKAIGIILQHEGGWVNNPNDPGGATNFGISLRFLADHPELGDFDHDGDVDAEDIKAMTVEDAKKVYKSEWWDKFNYGNIVDQTIATKVFDFSVNMGAKRAHILLQRGLNAAFGLKLTEDGIIGPATMSVINSAIDGSGEQQLLDAYSNAAWDFYQRIIQGNPKLAVFQKGWKNRAFDINKANSVS